MRAGILAGVVISVVMASSAAGAPLPHDSPLYSAGGSPIVNENPEVSAVYNGKITGVSGPVDQIEYTAVYGCIHISLGRFEHLTGLKVLAAPAEVLSPLGRQ